MTVSTVPPVMRLAIGAITGTLLAILVPRLLTPDFLCSETLTYILAGLLVAIALTPIVVLWRRGKFEFCDVSLGVVFSYLMHFAFGALFTTWFGARFISAEPGQPRYAILNGAVAVSIMGLVSMYIAYYGRAGARFTALFRPVPAMWNRDRIAICAFAAIVFGYAIRLGLMIGEAGSVGEFLTADKDKLMLDTQGITYLAAFSTLATPGLFALLVAGRLYRDARLMRFFWVTLPLDIFFRFFSGSRSSLVFLFLGLAVAFFLTSDRSRDMNRRYSAVCGLAVLSGILLFPLTSGVRFYGAIGNPFEIFEMSPQLQTVAGFTYFIGQRFHGVESLALLMDRVPREIPYTYDEPLSWMAVAWIPRSVWKDKPGVSLGMAFNTDVVPPGLFPAKASVSLTFPGEYYWAFGVPGVIGGMFLFGLVARATQTRLIVPHRNATAVMLAASMATTFLESVEQDTSYLITFGFFSYLLALGFGYLLARGAKQ